MIYFVVALFIILLPLAIAGFSLAPWVPTRNRDLSRIVALAELKSNDVFVELGSGNGRVVNYVAQNSSAQCIGVERAWPLYLISRVLLWHNKNLNAHIILGDLFKYDLHDATVIFVFGMPKPMKERLAQKIKNECKPGTRILSYSFHLRGLPDPVISDKPDPKSLSIYVYTL